MAKATKRFDIGERAVGGSIRVNVNGTVVEVKACRYKTDTSLGADYEETVDTTLSSCYRKLDSALNELTSSYHADQILTWIKTKVKLDRKAEYGW